MEFLNLRRPRITNRIRESLHQLGRVDAQGGGNLQDVDQAGVDLAAFEVADVGAVKSACVAKVLLAQTRLETTSANPSPEFRCLRDAAAGPLHPDECRPDALDASTANN